MYNLYMAVSVSWQQQCNYGSTEYSEGLQTIEYTTLIQSPATFSLIGLRY